MESAWAELGSECALATYSGPMESTGIITGRVIDSSGKPVVDATVLIIKGAGPYPDIAALTNDDGQFSFLDLTPGEYEVLVNVEDGRRTTAQFSVFVGSTIHKDIQL